MKQHYVPQCYLKAWCDPATPSGQEPYIWMFCKDGKNKKKKAPKKIFNETDMYTVKMPDGTKDYRFENGLHELEDIFLRIRDEKLKNKVELTVTEHVLLMTFVSAMHNRTKVQRDHHKEQWGKALDLMDKMKEWMKNATPEQKKSASGLRPPDANNSTLSYEDVEKLAKEPMQHMLYPMIQVEVPHLLQLNLAVFNTTTSPGFITSDRPCVKFDPKAYLRPPLQRTPGYIYPTIEVTLPISPNQSMLLSRSPLQGYIDADINIVNEYNRRTRFCSDEYFVVNSNITKEIWFDPGVEPNDSWAKTHEKNKDRPNGT